jgi:hypothetical protein
MLETKFKYEYQCINQQDEVVAAGEFYLMLSVYSIRSPDVRTKGIFGLAENRRDIFTYYRGQNHLKKVKMKVTNMSTKSVRYIG